MRALRWIASILICGVAIILFIGVIAPSNVVVRGSATIEAPAEIVFDQINRLENWQEWFPFESIDSTAEIQMHGPSAGVGAQMLWQSQKFGNGMTIITGSKKDKWITMSTDYIGDEITTSKWTFDPLGKDTKVTWTIFVNDLSYPFGRIKGLFFNSNMQSYLTSCFSNLNKLCRSIADTTYKAQLTTIEE